VRPRALELTGLAGWSKNGGTSFFSTEFFVLPQARIAVLISGDGFDYGATALAEGLMLRAAMESGAIAALPAVIVPRIPARAVSAPDAAPYLGFYGNATAPMHVLAEGDGTLSIRRWSAAGWTALQSGLRARSDGYWWSDGRDDRCFRFETVLGHRYLIARNLAPNRLYWGELATSEWLALVSEPLPPAWRARVGSRWRLDNESPDSVEARSGRSTFWEIDELAEFPGYVLLNNAQLLRVISDDEAGMSVQVPGNSGRDLLELDMRTPGELRSGSQIFKPVSPPPR